MRKGFTSFILLIVIGAFVAIGLGIGAGYLEKQSSSVETINEAIQENPISQAAEVIERIDPERQLAQARDVQRRSDLLNTTNAIYQYAAENDGLLPGDRSFPTIPTCIGSSPECFDLWNMDTINQYINVLPENTFKTPLDPLNGTEENTGYTIHVVSCTDVIEEVNCGRVIATAKGELEPEISVVR